jgi:putative tricarboxylic transport membrane protein
MWQAIMQGAALTFSLTGMFYTMIGTSVGYAFGLLPGLTASVAMSLLIPLTYGMAPQNAMMMLAGVLGGIIFAGSISAILFNMPGHGANAAVTLDGYAMSLQGRGGEALGASATGSFLGHCVGVFVLFAIIPVLTKLVLAFGPPEWFALGVGGLCLIASVSGGSLLSGVISAAVGLLLSMHGVNPIIGSPRFTFGQMWLWDGIPLIAFIVGTLALATMIRLLTESKTISDTGSINVGGVTKGVKETFRHLPTVAISGIIGTLVGAIPGIGGSVTTWIALSSAKAMSKDPGSFGKGNVEGVIAPESAGDATESGGLIPLIALGIPSSPHTAVMLGALIMHGLQPGQKMLTEHLPIVFSLSFSHLFGAFICCSVGLYFARYFARLTTVPVNLLVPILSVICMTGVFAGRTRLSDVILMVIFTGVGYALYKCDIPRVPMILGLILGPIIERSYQVTMQLSNGSLSIFKSRPIALAFLSLIPLSFVIAKFFDKRGKSASAAA